MNPPQAFPEQRVPSFNRFLFLNSFILHLFPPPGTLDGNFQNLFLHKILAALGCSEELKGLLKKKKCSWICIYLFILFKTEGFNKSVKFKLTSMSSLSLQDFGIKQVSMLPISHLGSLQYKQIFILYSKKVLVGIVKS